MSSEKDSISSSESFKVTSAPKDKLHFVYWTSFFVGLVILLPWNILITVNGYWDYKFRNTSLDNVETTR